MIKHQAIILLIIVGIGFLYGIFCFSEGPMVPGSHDIMCIVAFSLYVSSEVSLSLLFILPFAGVLLIWPFLCFQQDYVSSLLKPPQSRS